ncbi:M16 family metallopeptidase [Chloroflexota bacterium]
MPLGTPLEFNRIIRPEECVLMYQKNSLPNGLRVVTSALPYTQAVATSVFVGTGSRYETEAEAGISHFVEHMLFKGTGKRPNPQQISADIEGTGGSLNAGTDKEITVYWCKVAAPHFTSSLDVLSDMLLNSTLLSEEIEREKLVVTEEIKMAYDSPNQRVDMLIDELLWPGHPLGRDIAGTPSSVTSLTQGSLRSYMASHYVPSNAVVSIAGGIGHEEAMAAVSKYFGHWPAGGIPNSYQPAGGVHPSRVHIENRDTEQVQFCLALPGLSITHPERFTLDLLNVILGEGMSCHLFSRIRDEMGLAYSIGSYVDHFLDTGALTVAAGTDKSKLKTAISAVLHEMAEMGRNITEDELARAKEYAKGRMILRMEESHALASWTGTQETISGHIHTIDDIVEIVDQKTTAQLEQLLGELLDESKLRLAVVGPVSEDEPLEELLKL